MKRLNLLFFALFFIQFFCLTPIFALTGTPYLDASYITLVNEQAPGDTYANFGDTIEVGVIATFADPDLLTPDYWVIPPYVDLSPIGLGEIELLVQDVTVGRYSQTIDLSAWIDNCNFVPKTFTIRAGMENGTPTPTFVNTTTQPFLFDLTQVEGRNASFTSALSTTDFEIKIGEDIRVTVEDLEYQTSPLGGTKAYINLDPLNPGNAPTSKEIPYNTANGFRLNLDSSTQTYLWNIEYTGTLNISIKDPLNPAFVYVTNSFTIDTIAPKLNAGATTVRVTRDLTEPDFLAKADEVLRLTAAVTANDNETVWVQIPALTAGAEVIGFPAADISDPTLMATASFSGVGDPATWELDIRLSDADIKSDSMVASFTFIDDVGNVRTVTRTFRIDLETPAFGSGTPLARILRPFGGVSTPSTIGTTTCQIEFIASIPINVPPDNITVTVDISPIVATTTPLQQMRMGSTTGFTNAYRYVYPIVPGATEDDQNLVFTVTATDDAGNIVMQSTTPAINIDDISPTLANVTITSANDTIITGQTFTISAEAQFIETGSVTVNLSSIGLATYSPLILQSGNTYSNTFTLRASGSAAIGGGTVPYVEGERIFVVTARDTIAGHPELIAHTVTANTPASPNAKKFFNGSIGATATVLYADNSPTGYNVATTTCKIEVSANISTLGFVDPLTLTADFSSIGGPAAQAMPRVGATSEYRTTYTIPAGTPTNFYEDNALNSVSVTINDKDTDVLAVVNAVPQVAVDNLAPIFNSVTVISANPTVNASDSFTITAQVDYLELGTLTVDLSTIGLASDSVLPRISGNSSSGTYQRVFQLPVAGSNVGFGTVPQVEGLRSFVITARDTIASDPVNLIAHTVTASTPNHKFYNSAILVTSEVWYPDDTPKTPNTGVNNNVATSSCKIVVSAQVPTQGIANPLSLSVDFSSLGVAAPLAMPRVGATDEYRVIYEISPGAVEDVLANVLTVTINDKDGTQMAFVDAVPNVYVDNNIPSIASISIYSLQQTVLAGEVFEIRVIADGVENGTVSVDLTALGFAPTFDNTLAWDSSNLYIGSFTLPTRAAAGKPVEGLKKLLVTVTDSIASDANLIGNSVSMYSPEHRFYNGDAVITTNVLFPNDNPSPYNIATTSCKIVYTANIPISAALSPLTVRVDLSEIGGLANQSMPPTGVPNEYKFTYTIPDGTPPLEDFPAKIFTVSATAIDGASILQRQATPAVQIDNIKPTISNITLTSDNPTVLAGDLFTITANATLVENGSVTVDLTPLGFAAPYSIASLTLISGTTDSGTYQRAFVLPSQASASGNLLVEGNKSLKVSVNDTIATATPGFVAHIVSDFTPAKKFYNPADYTIVARVLLPNNAVSPYMYATATCKLEFIASFSATTTIAPLSGSVDLSEIGGPAALAMVHTVGSNTYVATYTIPASGILEDETKVYYFPVTMKDKDGTQIIKKDAPGIRIDNKIPVINSAVLSNGDPIINVGDTFTITVNASNIELGTVSVDLSPIDLTYATPTVVPLPLVSPGVYRDSFVLKDARASGIRCDAVTSFKITVNDTIGNPYQNVAHWVTTDTNAMTIDNEPPYVAAVATWSKHNTLAPDTGWIRIGDNVSFHANIASATQASGELVSITLDVRPFGQAIDTPMVASSTNPGWFDYKLPGRVATGTINQIHTGFLMTVVDNANNIATHTFVFPVDNQPVVPQNLTVETAIKPTRIADGVATVNFNKIATFKLSYIDVFDAATATIDLTSIGTLSAVIMDHANASYSLTIDTATTTAEYPVYNFPALVYDYAGNVRAIQSSQQKVDCRMPRILGASATIEAGVEPLKIGDRIRFRVLVDRNEGVSPTLDLTTLGGGAKQTMNDQGGGLFSYIATIGTGTWDTPISATAPPASFTVTAWDDDFNYVSTFTNELIIDNSPPILADKLLFTSNNDPVNIGSVASFSLTITSTPSPGLVTLDLRPIGLSANEVMAYDNNNTYSWGTSPVGLISTLEANAEYPAHIFQATVYDAGGNVAFAQSDPVNVDCQPIKFANDGIVISETNGDNPVATVANVGDILTVYASASAYIDATSIQATIGSGTVDFATATLVYNNSKNRHEANFTVGAPGSGGWGINNGNTLYYKLNAVDDAGNVATMVQNVSTFGVRNQKPTITASYTLNPNYDLSSAFNLGSSTVGDLMNVTASLANNTTMNKCWVDLSDLGGGTVDMTVAASSATTIPPISAASLPAINGETKNIYVIGQDEGGNKDTATFTLMIDNVLPQITSAQFDGQTVIVNISEEYLNASIDMSKWSMVGSATNGTPAYLNFTATQTVDTTNLQSFDIQLTNAQQIIVGNWASTPVYLRITNAGSSPLTDLRGNELPTAEYQPVTITDSSWRELPKVNQVAMTHSWPGGSTIIDIYFNKDVDPTTLKASSAVLLYKNLTYDYSSVDYTDGYVFTPLDITSWPDAPNYEHLRITLNATGTEWVARKVGTSNTLKFATRDGMSFVKDNLQRNLVAVSSQSPINAVDNRPTPNFNFDVALPVLDLASRSLKLTASDRLLLFTNEFTRANAVDPRVNTPTPTFNRRVTGFHNKITLYETDSGGSTVLQFEDLQIPADGLYASTTVMLKLNTTDVNNVINLFQNSASPTWALQINSGAFTNIWGTNNTAYMPSGVPGDLTMLYPAGYNSPSLAACSMNDKPPVNAKNAGELTFEVEMYPPNFDGAPVPIQTNIAPSAQIKRQDNDVVISGANFVNYSFRTVAGTARTVARFTNNTVLPAGYQRVPVYIEVTGIEDIFGGTASVTASMAYDLALKNDAAPDGFNDPASATIEIDTVRPALTQVIPSDYIGRIPSGTEFRVEFNENMNQSAIPVLQLATTTIGVTPINFTFTSWVSSDTARFTNNSAFTTSTPNGTWTYSVTGAQDEAQNPILDNQTDQVQVRTQAPEVAVGNVTIKTTQSMVNPTAILTSQPWTPRYGDPVNFRVLYSVPSVLRTPHRLEIYDANNIRYAEANITLPDAARVATATLTTFNLVDPGATGPTDYKIRIVDSAMNLTDQIATITYDNELPDVNSFTLTGVGSQTASAYYYRGDVDLEVAINTNTSDQVRLAVHQDYPVTTNASTAYTLFRTTGNNFTGTLSRADFPVGSHTLGVIDMAGNLDPSSVRRLIVDKTQPEVLAIRPNTVVGNCDANSTTFTVEFKEPMDAGVIPVLTLNNVTPPVTINMDFEGWQDVNNATTAYYSNREAITTSMPTATYTYRMTGGKDLAGNFLFFPSAPTFQVKVMTDGPFATISHLTDQSSVYGAANGIKTNAAYSPTVSGSATINIAYPAGPFTTPHRLNVYDAGDNLVASSDAVLNALNETLIFPDDFIVTPPGYTYSDQTYRFKIIDNSGTESGSYLPSNLKYDSTAPDVATISVGGPGIYYDTGVGAAYYYSSRLGSNTFSVVTNGIEELKLLVIEFGTATSPFTLTSSDGLNHSATLGGSLAPGTYIIGVADTAGNIGNQAVPLIVDNASPTVVSATPLMAGGYPAGSGNFVIEFNEIMNRNVSPTATIATSGVSIPLTFVAWNDETHCRFTNTNALSIYTPGTYSYQISGARDLAGNENTKPALGAFPVDLFTQAPGITARLYSEQPLLYTQTLVNQPFSVNVAPGVASLSLTYSTAPTQTPHELRIYNPANQQVSTITFDPGASLVATIAVDAAFFANPGNIGPATYKFKLVDQIGNETALSSTNIIYDALAPNISTATVTTVSDGSSNPLYYNEALHGPLTVKYDSTATDSLMLVMARPGGTATPTWPMTYNSIYKTYSTTLSTTQAAALATGTYVLTAVDKAGNFAVGAASTTMLVIDREIPQVVSVVSANPIPLTTTPVGGATFTVTFNETMKAMASPTLTIATGSTTINCTFTGWLDAPAYTQAQFKTATAITPSMPQGTYDYRVSGTDLTGNKLNNVDVGDVNIQSRGPVIAQIYSQSMQATTASGTEVLRDMPFSFNVAPGAATLSVKLSYAPVAPVHLHFMQTNTTIASYPLAFDASQNATYTWSTTTGPVPGTYQIKLADGDGDFSLESYNWTADASAPILLQAPTVTRGVLATDSVYFNPNRHSYLSVTFKASEPSAPRMRIRGANSTDTYALSNAGTNTWSGNFTGQFSRGADPKPIMPDGVYALDLVDVAGNVASPAFNYDIIIDRILPTVATYGAFVNGNPVSAFAPAAGNLEIRVDSVEPLVATGVYWVDVFNSANIKVNQLPLVASGTTYSAIWNGKTSAGANVTDGNYSFRASDYAGNQAANFIKIYTLTSAFKVMSAVQLSSSTAKLTFNHEVAADLSGAVITSNAAGVTLSNIQKIEPQAISFALSETFTHNVSYTFTVASGTISSIYGAPIGGSENSKSFTADGRGPVLSSVNFTGVNSQSQFKVVFDEEYTPATVNSAVYTLTGASGTPVINSAVAQSDNKTILLTAANDLVENADYQIDVSGLTDKYGNLSPTPNSKDFKGRDLTPPVLEVSAFSNPANENDIIVVVISNEDLQSPPVLQITQTNGPTTSATMQQGADSRSFMLGVTLSLSYPGTCTLVATARDLAGNQGSGNTSFTALRVSVNQAASIKSGDEKLLAEFSETSLKEDAMLKIIAHKLETGEATRGAVRTAMLKQARLAMGLRASQAADSSLDQSELVPMSPAYEVAIAGEKVKEGFNVFIDMPAATATTGLGLFYQSSEKWKFLSSTQVRGNKLAAKTSSSQMFAIMRDVKGPEVTLAADIDLNEPFRTSRPEFRGRITDSGSGLDLNSVTAHIDNGPAQNLTSLDGNGNFVFKPLADLTGGWHDLQIRAKDNTGNPSTMAAARFEVVVPLQITQIAQYPNPARVRTFIRISANRGDINEDLVRVKIYDVAGHRVATLDGIRPTNEKWGINARYVYDIPWDLRNTAGKTVANGVYFAKIEIRDPDNPGKKVKETFKIAVLR